MLRKDVVGLANWQFLPATFLNPYLLHVILLMTERTIVTLIWTTTKENTNFHIKIILDAIGAIYSQ